MQPAGPLLQEAIDRRRRDTAIRLALLFGRFANGSGARWLLSAARVREGSRLACNECPAVACESVTSTGKHWRQPASRETADGFDSCALWCLDSLLR
jgi:hypothetical protein